VRGAAPTLVARNAPHQQTPDHEAPMNKPAELAAVTATTPDASPDAPARAAQTATRTVRRVAKTGLRAGFIICRANNS
jgi:hypothetical protein